LAKLAELYPDLTEWVGKVEGEILEVEGIIGENR
jgi:hypothetical protein